nr:MAG TPA: hypothetical protein [Caudoviricetes sp.]
MNHSDYSVNKVYDKDGHISGIRFILTNYKTSENGAEARSVSLIYAVNEQRWFGETPFTDGAIALEPGRAFAIASSMGLEEKVAEILKEEDL